jgi:hypothetical protein
MISFRIISSDFQTWNVLFNPIILPPVYITNILLNFGKFNLFDKTYLFFLPLNHSVFWHVVFYLIGAIYFTIILISLSGRTNILKKIILSFLFILFSINLLFKGYDDFSRWYSATELTIGYNNYLPFILNHLLNIFASLIILSHIYKKVDLRFLTQMFIKYFFTILEILLGLFIGLIFIKTKLASDVIPINIFVIPLFVIPLGFFIFLIFELIKNYFLNKIK